MHADAWTRNGQVYASGPVVGYRVNGLSPGEEAKLWNFGGADQPDWQFLRNSNGKSGEWTGHYESAENALAALEEIVTRL